MRGGRRMSQGASDAGRDRSKPRRAAGSRATSKTAKAPSGEGASGQTHWGELWLAAFAKMPGVSAARMERGKAYALEGHVGQLHFGLGKIAAQVQGSRPKPYEVSVQVAPLDDATWERAIKAIRRRKALASALQFGEMPLQIDRIFQSLGVSLLPHRETDLVSRCSCPDWAISCKHAAALHYAVADSLARDPLALLELRGRSREQVLREIRRPSLTQAKKRRPRKGSSHPGSAPRPASRKAAGGDYDKRAGDLSAMRFRLAREDDRGAILEPLGQPPSWSRPEPILCWLEPTYQAASSLARSIALAET